jgi:hypothetical protein
MWTYSDIRRQPVLYRKARYSGKLAQVVGHQRQAQGAGVGGDKQIVRTDGPARALQPVANADAMFVYGRLQRERFTLSKHLRRSSRRWVGGFGMGLSPAF